MKILFLVGDIAISGGTYVILQHALYLKKMGHDVVIGNIFDTRKNDWHEALTALTIMPIDQALKDKYDIAIATWWNTVYYLNQTDACKIYFVQSIESFFVDKKETALRGMSNHTYSQGLPVITEAMWIKKYLGQQYAASAWLCRNGVRKDYLFSDNPFGTKGRLLIEGPVDVDFKNVPRTVALCRKYSQFKIWLLTSSPIDSFPGVERVISNVPASQVGEIYRQCDYLVKLSYVEGMFGPPLEMFHCGGTAIAYAVSGHDEYMVNDFNSLIRQPGDEIGIWEAIHSLENDKELLKRLKFNALATASIWPDWDGSSARFHRLLLHIYNDKNLNREITVTTYPPISPKKRLLPQSLLSGKLARTVKRKIKYEFLCKYVYPYQKNRGFRGDYLQWLHKKVNP